MDVRVATHLVNAVFHSYFEPLAARRALGHYRA